MKKYFSAEEIETIVTKRRQGVPWSALAAEVGMTAAGLRHNIKRVYGTISLEDKVCPYCQKTYTPLRIDCTNCGYPDCYLEHRKLHWQRWDRGLRNRTPPNPNKNEVMVKCLGNHCGGKSFRTPVVNDHGRLRPLYRVCPICRNRGHEYCMAWGGR